MDSGMFYGIQKGAVKALELSSQWYADLNRVYKKRRKLVFKLADSLGCTYDKEAVGMFVWARIPKAYNSSEAFADSVLYDKNIFITPGTVFGSNGEGYVRFSLCVTDEALVEAIERCDKKDLAI